MTRGSPRPVRDLHFLTVPNLLCAIRVLLLPVSILVLERQDQLGPLPALAVVGAALGTDALDGALARWRGWTSDSGRVLDPLADKIYLGGLVLYLILERGFPLWFGALVLVRDLVLIAASAIVYRRYRVVFATNAWGKVSTVALAVLVFGFLLRVEPLLPLLTAAAAAGVIVSFAGYVVNGWRFVRGRAPSAA